MIEALYTYSKLLHACGAVFTEIVNGERVKLLLVTRNMPRYGIISCVTYWYLHALYGDTHRTAIFGVLKQETYRVTSAMYSDGDLSK